MSEEVEVEPQKRVKLNQIPPRTDCPYLSTIKRSLLDFDFEKVCSISLANTNVYACLICGKYYQGKSQQTYAYLHSLEMSHHLFMNLHDTRVYCLPEMYEVIDQSLQDIKYNLNPTFDKVDDDNQIESRALDGSMYLPGFVGLNNLNKTDYSNVVIQAFCRVKVLRDFMIKVTDSRKQLSFRFGELVRKIWNTKSYKGHVSPHEFLQIISLKSNKLFTITKQSDPIRLISWLIDNIGKEYPSVINECFAGEVRIQYFKPLKTSVGYETSYELETKAFTHLTLDLPSVPLHKDQEAQIPHIELRQLLSKFNGSTNKDSADGRRRYLITKFPRYIIIHMRRFVMNNFFMEKNPTIVTFPLVNLDLNEILNADVETHGELKYSLIANICHEGNAKVGFYKVHLKNNNQWYQIQDLHKSNIVPQLITVSEAYIQVYERQ